MNSCSVSGCGSATFITGQYSNDTLLFVDFKPYTGSLSFSRFSCNLEKIFLVLCVLDKEIVMITTDFNLRRKLPSHLPQGDLRECMSSPFGRIPGDVHASAHCRIRRLHPLRIPSLVKRKLKSIQGIANSFKENKVHPKNPQSIQGKSSPFKESPVHLRNLQSIQGIPSPFKESPVHSRNPQSIQGISSPFKGSPVKDCTLYYERSYAMF
ncbi:hypothetical protein M8J77_010172 [Diaphorina citri]|nr:hypothetical protein M8J77_010172 [Diaphorina citri]